MPNLTKFFDGKEIPHVVDNRELIYEGEFAIEILKMNVIKMVQINTYWKDTARFINTINLSFESAETLRKFL